MGSSVKDEIGRIGDDIAGAHKTVFNAVIDPLDILSDLNKSRKDLFGGGGGGGGPDAAPPEIKTRPAPNLADLRIQEALKLARGRRNAQSGRASTVRTGPGGITGVPEVQPISLTGGA